MLSSGALFSAATAVRGRSAASDAPLCRRAAITWSVVIAHVPPRVLRLYVPDDLPQDFCVKPKNIEVPVFLIKTYLLEPNVDLNMIPSRLGHASIETINGPPTRNTSDYSVPERVRIQLKRCPRPTLIDSRR